MDTEAVRQNFLDALEDDEHPVWSVMLLGGRRLNGDGRIVGMIEVWHRHPLDGVHTCYACEEVKRDHPYVIDWLERRNRARLRLLAA